MGKKAEDGIWGLKSDFDLSREHLTTLLEVAGNIKRSPVRYANALRGLNFALLFEKPSLRTRLTFELAISQLGGAFVSSIGPIAEREAVKDVARCLGSVTQGIVARVNSQATIDELAKCSLVPVINALSDMYHPCQALGDALTLQEQLGTLTGLKFAYVGDGNNVCHSLMLTLTRLGMEVAVATPEGYEPKSEIVSQAQEFSKVAGGKLLIIDNPEEAVNGARAVYTDVWASMGHEHEAYERIQAFKQYTVDADLMAKADTGAIFMHCLPAKRGQEVTDAVIESPQSKVFPQAENRLHAQKALLVMLFG